MFHARRRRRSDTPARPNRLRMVLAAMGSMAGAFVCDVERLFHEFRAVAYRWAFAACRAHEEALDAVQEAFSRLIRERVVFANDRAAAGWLRRVTVGVVIDGWRRQKHLVSTDTGGHEAVQDGPTPDDIERLEQAGRLREALDGLSDRQRLVLIAKSCDGLTFAEIAEELGISTPTVKTHYLRALEALRERLYEYADSPGAIARRNGARPKTGATHELR